MEQELNMDKSAFSRSISRQMRTSNVNGNKKYNLMKKNLIIFSAVVLLVCCMPSCVPISFDQELLYGKWVSGTEYYRYDTDGTGATWDTSDDVSEAEAQEFTWTLEGSDLTHIHIMEVGGSVPKTYTVTALTATTLEYEDYTGKEFSYTKVD